MKCILIVNVYIQIQGFVAQHITNLSKNMRETANKRKNKQSNLDFTAKVSLYMFIVIHFALTDSIF